MCIRDRVLYDSSDKLTKEDLEAKLPGESKAVCIAGELPEEDVYKRQLSMSLMAPSLFFDLPGTALFYRRSRPARNHADAKSA